MPKGARRSSFTIRTRTLKGAAANSTAVAPEPESNAPLGARAPTAEEVAEGLRTVKRRGRWNVAMHAVPGHYITLKPRVVDVTIKDEWMLKDALAPYLLYRASAKVKNYVFMPVFALLTLFLPLCPL